MGKFTPEQIEEFKVEESEASNSRDFRVLALRVSEVKQPDYYVGNKNWAKRLLIKAEEVAINFDDFSSLGRVISTGDILGDWVTSNIDINTSNIDIKKWNQIEHAFTSKFGWYDGLRHLIDVGREVHTTRSVFELSEKESSQLINKLRIKYEKEPTWHENHQSTIWHNCFYDGIVISKKHKDWGRKLFKKAEDLASTSEELNILASYVEGLYDEMFPELNENDILKDKKWSHSLRTKADNR